MDITAVVCRENGQNCYLVRNGGYGILIDPGMDTLGILKAIENVKVNYVLLTHCHYDHIYSVNELGRKTVSSAKCSENMQNPTIVLLPEACTHRPSDITMEDGEVRSFDGIEVKCIHTPGHTNGGVCYLIDDCLFSGDTLFAGSVGRTDLPTGNSSALEKSVREKLYNLPDYIAVYPGHGGKTAIGYEKTGNMYIRA